MKQINKNISIFLFFFILLSSLLLVFCEKKEDNTQNNDEPTTTTDDSSTDDNSNDDDNTNDVKFTEADTIQLSEVSVNIEELLSNENYLNNVLEQDVLSNIGGSFRLSETSEGEQNLVQDIIIAGKDTAIRTEKGDSVIFRRDSIIIMTYPSPTSTEWMSKHIRTRKTLDKENKMFPKTRYDEYRDFNPGDQDGAYLGQTLNGKIYTIIYNPFPVSSTEAPQRSFTKISNFKIDTITIYGTMRDFDSFISADENGRTQLKRTNDTMEYTFASGNIYKRTSRKYGIIIFKTTPMGYPIFGQVTINGVSSGSDSKGNKWTTEHKDLLRKRTCVRGQVPISGERVTQFTLANGKSFESKIIYAGYCADTCTQVVTDEKGNSYTKTIKTRHKNLHPEDEEHQEGDDDSDDGG